MVVTHSFGNEHLLGVLEIFGIFRNFQDIFRTPYLAGFGEVYGLR